MNKKIALEIALGIIVLISIIIFVSIYLSGKKEIKNSGENIAAVKTIPNQNISNTNNSNPETNKSIDVVALPSSGPLVLRSGESVTGDIGGQQVMLMNANGNPVIKIGDNPPKTMGTTENVAGTIISLMSYGPSNSINFYIISPNTNPHGEIKSGQTGVSQGMETPTVTFKSGQSNFPAGFLVPIETSIPAEYRKFLQHNDKDGYAIQYNVGEDRYMVNEYIETEERNCMSQIEQQSSYLKRHYPDTTIKDFKFQDMSGTVIRGNLESHLYLKDGNRCLRISNYVHDGVSDSSDTLIAELNTFVRE